MNKLSMEIDPQPPGRIESLGRSAAHLGRLIWSGPIRDGEEAATVVITFPEGTSGGQLPEGVSSLEDLERDAKDLANRAEAFYSQGITSS